MPIRAIRHEHGVDDQLEALGIGFRRYDELMEFINETLAQYPEVFRVIPGTKISICKTNEFVGNSFPDIPALVFYFHYDNSTVTLISVEINEIDSYGVV